MSDFKVKMHQIRFPLGLCLRPRWGSLQRSHRPKLYLRGLLLREVGGRGREKRSGREGKDRGEEEGRD